MKKLILIACTFMATASYGQQFRVPAPSPLQTIRQDFGTGNIELSYGRPGAKNRKIMGDLVPFGKVWRTGANSATTLTFSQDVTIGGKELKAGKYGLVSIPGEDKWTLIITKDLNVTSPSAYKQENDIVRVDAKVSKMDDKVETFTMQFGNLTNNSVDLQMMWEKTLVSLPISTNTDARVMTQIENIMLKDNRPYFDAASYYYENGKDMKQAMEWVNKAIDNYSGPYKPFWMHMMKARIALKLNDKSTAKASAEKTLELATQEKNDDYVKIATDFLKSL